MALAYRGVHKRDWHCKRLTGFTWQGQVSGWHAIKWLEEERESVVGGHLRFWHWLSLQSCHLVWIFRSKKFHLTKWARSLHGCGTTAPLGKERRIGPEEKHAASTLWLLPIGLEISIILPLLHAGQKELKGRLGYTYLFIHSFIHPSICLFIISYIYSINKNVFFCISQVASMRIHCSCSEEETEKEVDNCNEI